MAAILSRSQCVMIFSVTYLNTSSTSSQPFATNPPDTGGGGGDFRKLWRYHSNNVNRSANTNVVIRSMLWQWSFKCSCVTHSTRAEARSVAPRKAWYLAFLRDPDIQVHRPYSRQVTEQLPLSGSLHSHQLVYLKAGNLVTQRAPKIIDFLEFILMFLVVVYRSPPLVSTFYARLTITSWCVPGE